MPQGIQLKRVRGWRLPSGAVKVARPTIYGNPFRATQDHPAEVCVREYQEWLEDNTLPFGLTYSDIEVLGRRRLLVLEKIPLLRGHDLACFCRLQDPCHRNVLLELAN